MMCQTRSTQYTSLWMRHNLRPQPRLLPKSQVMLVVSKEAWRLLPMTVMDGLQ